MMWVEFKTWNLWLSHQNKMTISSFQLSIEGKCNCSLQGFTSAHSDFFRSRIFLINHNLIFGDSSKICKLSTPQYNNALRLFQILKQSFGKFRRIVNCSMLLIKMHFLTFKLIKTANTGLRLSLTETVIHSHACVRATVNHRPFTSRH